MKSGRRWLVALAALALVAAACSSGDEQPEEAAGPLTVMASWGGDEQAGFYEVLNAFTAETGIAVVYEAERDLVTVLPTRIAGGTPPDIAMVPRPGIVAGFVADGVLTPLCCGGDDVLAEADLNAAYADGIIQLGTFDGDFYGLLVKSNSKSTFWYKPASFADLGVEIPETWDELLAIVDAYVAAGKTPIAMGGLDGWTLTDWFENIYVRVAGAEKYNQLFVTHEISWNDPTVVTAMERFAEIISPTDDKLAGGAAGALSTGFIDAFDLVLNGDAEMYYEGGFMGGFAAENFPDLVAGEDYSFFEFPSIDPAYGKPVVGGGDMAVMLNDSPNARALIRFLAGQKANTVWATAEKGSVVSPNSLVPLDSYTSVLTQKEAAAVANASVLVFDGSDLAPGAVGGDAMFTALQDFVDDPSDIAGVLQFIEDAAMGAY